MQGATISRYEVDAYSTPNNALDLNARNFRVAFAFDGYLDEKLKADPRYVKWIFRVHYKNKNGEFAETLLPYHKCTEEDYAEFYPI